MKHYHDLYLKCDALLLADVFGKCGNISLKNYGLSPSHYLNASGLSWDAMLKITKIELELITDPGMTYSLKKIQEVEFLIFLIDTGKPTINIYGLLIQKKNVNSYTLNSCIFLEANNIYDYAMSKFPSTSGFKWINPKELDLNRYTSNSSKIKNVFLKLILNIQKNYENHIMVNL